MIPFQYFFVFPIHHLSRVCGDDPISSFCNSNFPRFVPRMRGWSQNGFWNWKRSSICPAYAGMIPSFKASAVGLSHLSRVCGDDPLSLNTSSSDIEFVPRMRGWSRGENDQLVRKNICPAYAGVILLTRAEIATFLYLSRVCGGDPKWLGQKEKNPKFVPRMRGWSQSRRVERKRLHICPAYAGVIPKLIILELSLKNLSRVCGGDPKS